MENNKSQIVIYKDQSGQTKIDVRFDGDTVWLSQKQMAKLFDCSVDNISLHLKNIFKEAELSEKSVVEESSITAVDGKKYDVKHYNLDAIISVGYRINSKRGTQFRIWATQKLKEFILKGFVLDDERLKNPDLPFDYFEELTRRIADIRTSEKRFYRKITDIYATSIDYDPTDEKSILFFKTVQNKVHYAITGNTAAEIVINRMDSNKKNLGLTNFRGAKPTKEEIIIAKNYLSEQELLVLNNLVEQYLVFAQGQAMQRVPMTMNDWIEKLHGFLAINDRNILQDAGKISHELMVEIAGRKFEEYKKIEATEDTDFDAVVLDTIENAKNKLKLGDKKLKNKARK
jgi:hypothetical protein